MRGDHVIFRIPPRNLRYREIAKKREDRLAWWPRAVTQPFPRATAGTPLKVAAHGVATSNSLGFQTFMPSIFNTTIFGEQFDTDWHMQGGERATMLYLLNAVRPQVSVEIGTFRCGSLRPIAHLSKRVYTFDIDPNQHRAKTDFPNVEFVTGDTAVTLQPVIEMLSSGEDSLDFILIDGSHETEGVRIDIEACLRYHPRKSPCIIVMHDSSNPVVRQGIMAADWNGCPYVHGLDLDFVPGALYGRADIRNQIWGGLAVAVLLPEPRSGALEIQANFSHSLHAFDQFVHAEHRGE